MTALVVAAGTEGDGRRVIAKDSPGDDLRILVSTGAGAREGEGKCVVVSSTEE